MYAISVGGRPLRRNKPEFLIMPLVGQGQENGGMSPYLEEERRRSPGLTSVRDINVIPAQYLVSVRVIGVYNSQHARPPTLSSLFNCNALRYTLRENDRAEE